MKSITFTTNTKTVQADFFQNENILALVASVRSNKTGKQLAFYRIPVSLVDDLNQLKSFTALVNFFKLHDTINPVIDTPPIPPNDSLESTACPAPVPAPAKSAERGRDILFVDVETTGTSYKDEIVEIAVVDINERIVFESLVKPSKPIPKQATAVHKITNAMVASAPTFDQIWDKLATVLGDCDLVFYNEAFDTRMIAQSACISFGHHHRLAFCEILLNKTSCLMNDYAKHWGEWSGHGSYKWQTLISACRQQKILTHDIPNHRASGDAIKTARLYKEVQRQCVFDSFGAVL